MEFHSSLPPVLYLSFRIQQRLDSLGVYVTRNGEIKDDGVGERLAPVDYSLAVSVILSFPAIPPCRSWIVPRSIRSIGGSGGSSASGAYLDVVIDLRNQAMRIGICDALVGAIDEHTWADMADLDIGVAIDAVAAGERNEDGSCHD